MLPYNMCFEVVPSRPELWRCTLRVLARYTDEAVLPADKWRSLMDGASVPLQIVLGGESLPSA